jgi:hypothetical protein
MSIRQEAVIAVGPHAFCCRRLPTQRTANGLDDPPTGLRVEFDFFGHVRLVEERLRNPNPSRVADLHDPRPDGFHVITV